MRRFIFFLVCVFLMGCPGADFTQAAGVLDPLDRPALKASDPAQCVLLDVTEAGTRLVAVGERGVVVLSDDAGKTWRQAGRVPTSVTLTGVQFLTPILGWVVGHAGVVLHTQDGGETWERRLDGRVAADIALKVAQEAVRSKDLNHEAALRQLAQAEQLVSDGPDKPFLDLYFKDDLTGFIVGAYGLIFHTRDGGMTWEPWMDRVDNPDGYHLYCIRGAGDKLYIAGEMGLFLRSTENGHKFERVETPYEGSFFTLVEDASGGIILGGLRGNAYRTTDGGMTFFPVQVPVPISFSAAIRQSDGVLIFANQGGFLMKSLDNGQSLTPVRIPRLPPVAALLPLGANTVITVGAKGAKCVTLTGTSSSEKSGEM